VAAKSLSDAVFRCHKVWYPRPRMEPRPRQTFEPAGAGALLGGVTAAGVGAGALVGWAAGSVGLGILGGAFVGVPAGVAAVYFRYRNAL
jgi:hypothetical protein